MLRFVFVLCAAFYLLLGAALYFFPVAGFGTLTVSPTWVARLCGALVLAWGVQLALSSTRPGGPTVAGLVVSNLLVAATLAPAVLSGQALSLPVAPVAVLAISLALVVLAVLAIVSPREPRRF
ncbi:hypothetical protein [Deinococcus pimensis]|uniref:hypothetical protein n=1 Tax=Deinococcus pimensis TaxID=309888 RepID=UPI0004BA7610|nr:hypothetical protein [Deinococcus pimensis]